MTTATDLDRPVINDPRLQFNEELHAYSLGGRPLLSVTQALHAAGMVDTTHWNEFARVRGAFLHKAIALLAEGDLDEASIDPQLAPYFDAFKKFLRDTDIRFEHIERRVCDPRMGYAGTLDAIGRWPFKFRDNSNPRRTLFDWKSGYFPPMAAPQTAAYLRCARALYPTGILIDRAGLQLKGDGTYSLKPLTDIVQDEADFIAALRVAQFRERHGIQ